MTVDTDGLKRRIQKNCDISDARYGGRYSLCGLLLRMRDLYKWEKGYVPWEEPEPACLMEWIEARESRWEELLEEEFRPLQIGGDSFDPFDTAAINARLQGSGLIYGAGFAARMKPSFFLAEVQESKAIGNLKVDVIDRELVRDLFMAPAMRQGTQIFARRSAMLFFIWDLILEMKASVKHALIYALAHHRLEAESVRRNPRAYAADLRRMAEAELDTWIYHEVGEAREAAFNGDSWRELVSAYPDSPVEYFARLIKDWLADTHPEGLLRHVAEKRLNSSLGFYIAFMSPFMRAVFPDILEAFKGFESTGDWSLIEEAREKGHSRAHWTAEAMTAIHEEGRTRGQKWAGEEIIAKLIRPTGALGTAEREDEA